MPKKVGIIGSGPVGQVLGKGFCTLNYEVKIGSRTPNSDKLKAWLSDVGGKASAGTFAEAASYGDILVLATLGDIAESVIDLAGPEKFGGKTVIDATNPLDFSKGMPPGLTFPITDSLGEHVQRKVPNAKVVKCFNTVTNSLMFKPRFKDAEMLICGNDSNAKQETTKILKEFGWAGSIDIGGIENARWLEALVPLWVRAAVAKGSWDSMFTFVK
ncbi:MAG: NADPH-dependent F420 reductase [Nitrososphaerales archaeon]